MSLAQGLPLRICNGRSEKRPSSRGALLCMRNGVSYVQAARSAAGARGRPPAGCRRHEMRRSRMKINSLVGGAAVGLIAALAIAGAATAQDTKLPSANDASEYLSVTITVTDNCAATITYTNAIPDEFSGSWAYWGDYRVGEQAGQPDSAFPDLPLDSDGQLAVDEYQDGHNHGVTPEQQIASGPLAGEEFGLQYNPVLIHRG